MVLGFDVSQECLLWVSALALALGMNQRNSQQVLGLGSVFMRVVESVAIAVLVERVE